MAKGTKRKKTQYKGLTEVKTREKRVWQDVKPNFLELSNVQLPSAYGSGKMPNLSVCGSRKMLDSTPLSLVVRQA
jgi:hypothetical protein